MAATKVETQITWPTAAASITVNNTSWNLSELIAFDVSDWQASIQMLSGNQGTPASGDTNEFRILYQNGEVDGTAGDDYVNPENGEFLDFHDTFNNAAAGGIVMSNKPVRTSNKGFKLAVKCATGSTRNQLIRARLVTHRGSIA